MNNKTSFTGRWGRFLVVGVLILSAVLLQACSSETGLQVGADAPAFSLQSADGSTVSLDEYAAQPVLLYFHMAMG
ncbi:MAG: redoxin domain-containing protein [Anaerolineales bacterium]|nr:redoxin domain-containing protein [Chloroflexota bacterium]MBL7161350.1 redoxin domain-containing protein [Anaerolineales bacterium]